MSKKLDDLEYVEKAFLGFMEFEGFYKPGDFLCFLFQACLRADTNNKIRLSEGFPVVVRVVIAYQTGKGIEDFPIMKKKINGKG